MTTHIPAARGDETIGWVLLGRFLGIGILTAVLILTPGCRGEPTGAPGPPAGSAETGSGDSRESTPQPGAPRQTPTIRVEGGDYVIGSDEGVSPTPADERPAHAVSLKPFAIDKYEVTNARFARFLNALDVDPGENTNIENDRGELVYEGTDDDAHIDLVDGRFFATARYEDHPANEVTWYGGRDYCAWRGARLPTEAEWEAAARGFERRTYPWGDAPPTDERARFGAGWNETAPVGSHPAGATPDGTQDMAGNVSEWTSTLYRPYPYDADDGREDLTAEGERVTRGGNHDYSSAEGGTEPLLSAARTGFSRDFYEGHHQIGFRCARPVKAGD